MEEDYFPHNQWISDNAQCNDPSSAADGSFLIVGKKGVHKFTVDLRDEMKPTVTTIITVRNFKLQ
jgi:hypothetical protein